MAATLTGTGAARASGVGYRQLDYWARLGLLGDDAAGHVGSGIHREFTPRHVRMLQFLAVATPAVRVLTPAVFREPTRLAADASSGETVVWWVERNQATRYAVDGCALMSADMVAAVGDGYQGRIVVWRCLS